MTIAIDYDDTFTKDPKMWAFVIPIIRKKFGHEVICVTARQEDQLQDVIVALHGIIPQEKIFATSYDFKRPYLQKKGIKVDIWIDDMPEMISSAMIIK